MLTAKEAQQLLNEIAETMNDLRLDDTWKILDKEMQRRQKETQEWFNNLLKIAIAATIIQTIALAFACGTSHGKEK